MRSSEELKEYLDNNSLGTVSYSKLDGDDWHEDLKDFFCEGTYLSDAIMEFADSKVDIYTYDLYNWLRNEEDAPEWMEEVVLQGLINDREYSFTNHIQMAQYVQLEQMIYDDLIPHCNDFLQEEFIYLLKFPRVAEAIDQLDKDALEELMDELDEILDFPKGCEIDQYEDLTYLIVSLINGVLTEHLSDEDQEVFLLPINRDTLTRDTIDE